MVSKPEDQWVCAEDWVIVLCSWAKHLTFKVPLYPGVHVLLDTQQINVRQNLSKMLEG